MAIPARACLLYLCLAIACYVVAGHKIANVLDFGAKANRRHASTTAFVKAWQAACKSTEEVTLLVPVGEFFVSSLIFAGPCTTPKGITVQVDGTLVAPTDTSEYVNTDWIIFQDIVGLNIVGNGTFDAQGTKSSWNFSPCNKPFLDCLRPPSTLQLNNVKNAVIENIKSVDAMGLDILIRDSANLTLKSVQFNASKERPNEESIHILNSPNVVISETTIQRAKDCVSVVKQATDVAFTKSKCGLSQIQAHQTQPSPKAQGVHLVPDPKILVQGAQRMQPNPQGQTRAGRPGNPKTQHRAEDLIKAKMQFTGL